MMNTAGQAIAECHVGLSRPAVEHAVARLADRLGVDARTAAAGIEDLVVENMAAATRMHLAEKGRDPRAYTLMAFGGAGPVHAYALAKRLKMPRIIIPVGAGVMSAFGFLVAAPAVDEVRGYPASLTSVDWDKVASLYADMETRARRLLQPSATARGDLLVTRTADMRYVGQGFQISVPLPDDVLGPAHEDQIRDAFVTTYRQVFGRVIRDGTPEFVSWRLSASRPPTSINLTYRPSPATPGRRRRPVHFAGLGAIDAEVYDRYELTPGTTIAGLALFEERETSCSVGPDCTVTIDSHRNLIIDIGSTS